MTTYTIDASVWVLEGGDVRSVRPGEISFVTPDDITSFSYYSLLVSGQFDSILLDYHDALGLYADGVRLSGPVAGEAAVFNWGMNRDSHFMWIAANIDGEQLYYMLELYTWLFDVPDITTLDELYGFLADVREVSPLSESSFFPAEQDIDLGLIPDVRVTQDDWVDLQGGLGPSVFETGVGNDTISVVSEAGKTVDGGAGYDLVDFGDRLVSDYTITLADDGIVFQGSTESMTVRNVEYFAFGASDGTLSEAEILALRQRADVVDQEGTDGADFLEGDDNNDRLVGFAGNDTLIGGLGADTLNAGDGDDNIQGGSAIFDERDTIYAGGGNDSADGGYGNDLIYGGDGNDTLLGGFGADELIGQAGDDVLSGGAYSDQMFGGEDDDFLNGGYGHDRLNGGNGVDRFYHLGQAGHGSDWIQDYRGEEQDILVFGSAADLHDFQVNYVETAGAGLAGVEEAFVIYRPTGQIIWALVDGGAQSHLYLRASGQVFDLVYGEPVLDDFWGL